MTWEIILQIVLFGVALSMDAFAVAVTDGLTYTDINKKKSIFIAGMFGLMQALMPLLGYWLVEGITVALGTSQGNQAGQIMSTIVTWIAFGLLVFIGGKMIVEAILDLKKPAEERKIKKFSVKEVLIMSLATAIDALAVGVLFHAGLSTNTTIWLHVVIIMVITFIISILGLFLGHFFDKLLKGKYTITSIIGGAILLFLAIWVVLSYYLGI